MNRRTLLEWTGSIGAGLVVTPSFGRETMIDTNNSQEDELERLFPQKIGLYDRLRVDSDRVVYRGGNGGLLKVVNEDDQRYLSVIADSLRFGAVSWGQASRLLESYVESVEYQNTDGDLVYTGDGWEVVYRYHEVLYRNDGGERVYEKKSHSIHPLDVTSRLVEWSVPDLWSIREVYREMASDSMEVER